LPFGILLEAAVVSGRTELLQALNWKPLHLTFAYRRSAFEEEQFIFDGMRLSYLIGSSVGDAAERFFVPSGKWSGLGLYFQYYLNGLAGAGKLEKLKEETKYYEFAQEEAESWSMCAFEGMHENVLDWLISDKGVTFNEKRFQELSEDSNAFFVDLVKVFFSEIRIAGTTVEPALFLKGIRFLEKHGACLAPPAQSLPMFIECIYGRALDAVLYMDKQYQTLSKLLFVVLEELFDSSAASNSAVIQLLLERRPDLFTDRSELSKDQFMTRFALPSVMNFRFAANASELNRNVQRKYYRNLLVVLELAEEKIYHGTPSEVVIRADEMNLKEWKVITQRALSSSEATEFFECVLFLARNSTALRENFFDHFMIAVQKSAKRMDFINRRDYIDVVESKYAGIESLW